MNAANQRLTGEAPRIDGHAWRKRAGAILTGVGTVLDDDPRLYVRLVPTDSQPLRVIVDSKLQTPPSARMLAPPGRVLIYAGEASAASQATLQAAGAEIAFVPGASGRFPSEFRTSRPAVAGASASPRQRGSAVSGRRGAGTAGTAGNTTMNTMTHKGYTARIEYDERDNILVGRLLGVRCIISFHADTVADFVESSSAQLKTTWPNAKKRA